MNCGPCENLNRSRKKCNKYNKKLGYMSYKSKSISLTSYEKCKECINDNNQEDKRHE
jgi:hypothetical protein